MNVERVVAARVFRTLSIAEIRVMDAWLATRARKTFPQRGEFVWRTLIYSP